VGMVARGMMREWKLRENRKEKREKKRETNM
jgi:hypothetical protein